MYALTLTSSKTLELNSLQASFTMQPLNWLDQLLKDTFQSLPCFEIVPYKSVAERHNGASKRKFTSWLSADAGSFTSSSSQSLALSGGIWAFEDVSFTDRALAD